MTLSTSAPAAPRKTCARLATAVLLGLTSLCAGCTVTTAAPAAGLPPPGAAILDWTIAGTKDPGACQQSGAATFHVRLFDSAGGFSGEWVQDCTAFATTVGGLAPDAYTGQAELRDPNGQPRTTTVNLAPFDVIGNTSVTVAVDFPPSSFF